MENTGGTPSAPFPILTVEEARDLILKDAAPLGPEEVPLGQALGRVLAEECRSDVDLPPFDRSMMDGYALRSSDPGPLRVIEEIPAGRTPSREIRPGMCSKIMTGAPVPQGADAVQQVEKTSRDGQEVTLQERARPGQNIAPRGNELRSGEAVLSPGRRLRAAEVGALAAIGRSRVRVFGKPRVAVLATGDELVPPEVRPGPGQIRNSNSFSLAAQVRQLGLECDDLGVARDQIEAIRAGVREGRKRELLLLSGGVSAGDYDRVLPALRAESVAIRMHQAQIKPGRPFCFGPGVFGLPGNPVSSFVIFEVFVRPYLGRLMGTDLSRPVVLARLETAIPQKIDRVHYLPAVVREERGGRVVRTVPWKGSADLVALTRANAFVIVPVQTAYDAGADVPCMLLLD
jgi:molybdopterin molybdotransferase